MPAPTQDGKTSTSGREKHKELFPGSREGLLTRNKANLQVILRVRNKFGHYQQDVEGKGLTELKSYARDFFEALVGFMRYLDDHAIFPRTISIREFVKDRFGRTFVRAVDDRGKEEIVFTDQELDPTKSCFMHPTSKPIRLYPRLVPRT